MQQSDFTSAEIIPGKLTKKMQPVMQGVERYVSAYRQARGEPPPSITIRKAEYQKILKEVTRIADRDVSDLVFHGIPVRPYAE